MEGRSSGESSLRLDEVAVVLDRISKLRMWFSGKEHCHAMYVFLVYFFGERHDLQTLL